MGNMGTDNTQEEMLLNKEGAILAEKSDLSFRKKISGSSEEALLSLK